MNSIESIEKLYRSNIIFESLNEIGEIIMTEKEAREAAFRSNKVSETLRENRTFFPVKITNLEWKVANCEIHKNKEEKIEYTL